MKRLLLLLLIVTSTQVFAQINEKGFSFQGYARDFEGTALGNQEITVRFSIYPEGGSNAFVEEHTVSTDPFGVFGATVGSVNQGAFFGLDWHNQNYWLQTEVRAFGATDFVEISNTELLSVPYAQAAGNGVPTGTILPFGGTKDKIPVGFVACDGAVYDGNQFAFAKLFSVIDYNWGRSGGLFRVPDLRGYFLRGVSETFNDPDHAARTFLFNDGTNIFGNDDNTGTKPGSYQSDDNKSHNHTGNTTGNGDHSHSINSDLWGLSSGGGDDAVLDLDNNGHVGNHLENTNIAGHHSHSFTTDLAGGSESRPRNAYVWYIIKL